MNDQSWKPTKKWITALLTGLATIGGSWLLTGAFDDVERGMAAALALSLAGSYFKTNDATITGDGVPAKDGKDQNLAGLAGYALVELLIVAILLVVFIAVVFAVID